MTLARLASLPWFALVSLAGCGEGSHSTPGPRPFQLYPNSQTRPLPTAPVAVVSADLDGDGRTELVVCGAGGPGNAMLEVFDDDLGSRGTYDLGWALADVELGDLDLDGRLDLVAIGHGSQGEGYMHVLFGQAKLGFELGLQGAVLGLTPADVELADVNGDGELDLVTCDEGSKALSVVLNTPGPGRALESPLTHDLSYFPSNASAGDLNGDGVLDLVVASEIFNYVGVLLGAGDGTFIELSPGIFTVTPTGLALADLDADGKLDLVFTATQGSEPGLQVCFGAGGGGFASHHAYDLGGEPRAPLVLDFDGDGSLDVVVANRTHREVTVLRGNPFGFFSAPVSYATEGAPEGVATFGPALGGLAMVTTGPDALVIGLGVPSYPATPEPTSLDAVDFNGDGTYELLLADGGIPGGVRLLGRQPTSSGESELFEQRWYDMGGPCAAAVMGDFNGDGILEPAAALVQPGGTHYVSVALAALPLTQLEGFGPVALRMGYLDGDLHADLLVAQANTEELEVLFGKGTGKFSQGGRYPVGQAPAGLEVAYLNGDSILDAVVLNGHSGDVSVLIGFADGSFAPEVRYAANSAAGAGSTSADFALSDLDDNGLADLVVVGLAAGDGQLAVLFSNGDGSFRDPVVRPLGGDPRALVLADVWSRDGRPDLLVVDRGSSQVRLFVGQGGTQFGSPSSFLVGIEPFALASTPSAWSSGPEVFASRAVSGKVAVLTRRVFTD